MERRNGTLASAKMHSEGGAVVYGLPVRGEETKMVKI
jgi:hypothetical protein